MQRETEFRGYAKDPDRPGPPAVVRTSLPGTSLSPADARQFVRTALADWSELGVPAAAGLTDRVADDAVLLVSELVTNAVVHAGTAVELLCRLDEAGPGEDTDTLVIEVSDHHPSRAVRGEQPPPPGGTPEYGRGLRLVATLSESWGITYRTGTKTVWARLSAEGARLPAEAWLPTEGARLPAEGARSGHDGESSASEQAQAQALQRGPRTAEILAPLPRPVTHDTEWVNRGALSFLAEASDLLAGQFDEDLVAALAGQLLVPRLADWCAVWLDDASEGPARAAPGAPGARLARVWHTCEHRVEELRRVLEKDPPQLPDTAGSGACPVPWPGDGPAGESSGTALAYRLTAGGRALGTLVIGRTGLLRFPDEVTGLVEDFSRRVALAVSTARRYQRQANISQILQRGLLPSKVAQIPGVQSGLVYEPRDKGGPGGDFYDVFQAGAGRWCFALGDVQGKGPEAAVVIGLARPWLRLLAREGYQVAEVLDRLNQLLLDDATEAADAAAAVVAVAGGQGVPADGATARFLSLLYGELVPYEGGVRCTIACAGHPLPLLLSPEGEVRAAATPQMLLGVVDDETYTSESFDLRTGDTLLCVTDGVTERRSGRLQFDDGDGLARALAECAGLDAGVVAERIRRLVHEFSERPPDDDMALLVLRAE
ncbi:SpoIIE family protein phosphatase [Streptomyces sp. BG9H]|uniref:SpoIIE family protein phosphatase n=2 Tax=Streptomyces anatolicus TaxID=2675858 RepID=A0ABS6YXR7_9ACTN|nr:ATP-binding SpoIIE family protein phosphatase [Streptomyces anatolicus]MBW5425865.1 SpoIIE family protein phosphatase [Streptomyces anatolicus]